MAARLTTGPVHRGRSRGEAPTRRPQSHRWRLGAGTPEHLDPPRRRRGAPPLGMISTERSSGRCAQTPHCRQGALRSSPV